MLWFLIALFLDLAMCVIMNAQGFEYTKWYGLGMAAVLTLMWEQQKDAEKKVLDLQKKVSALEGEKKVIEEDWKEQSLAQITRWDKDYKDLEKYNIMLRNRINELTRERNNFDFTLNAKKDEVMSLNRRLLAIYEEKDAVEEKLSKTTAEKLDIEDRFTNVVNENSDLYSQVESNDLLRNALQDYYHDMMETDKQRLSTRFEEKELQIEDLNAKITELQEQLEGMVPPDTHDEMLRMMEMKYEEQMEGMISLDEHDRRLQDSTRETLSRVMHMNDNQLEVAQILEQNDRMIRALLDEREKKHIGPVKKKDDPKK